MGTGTESRARRVGLAVGLAAAVALLLAGRIPPGTAPSASI